MFGAKQAAHLPGQAQAHARLAVLQLSSSAPGRMARALTGGRNAMYFFISVLPDC